MSLEFLLESVSLPVLTQSQRDALFLFCLSQLCSHSCPVWVHTPPKQCLHGDTHTGYRPTFKVCVRPFFLSLSLPKQPLNCDKSADKGFPLYGLRSPRQHSWVDKHWPSHTRGSPRNSKRLSCRVVTVVAIVVAASQWGVWVKTGTPTALPVTFH